MLAVAPVAQPFRSFSSDSLWRRTSEVNLERNVLQAARHCLIDLHRPLLVQSRVDLLAFWISERDTPFVEEQPQRSLQVDDGRSLAAGVQWSNDCSHKVPLPVSFTPSNRITVPGSATLRHGVVTS
jgi:hypothetical protein